MRLPFLSLFVTSPFEGIQEHAEKVRECAWSFQQAMECHVSQRCEGFGDFRKQVNGLEHEADAIKRRIRGHIPKGTLLPVDKFQLFRYLREQDSVLDSVQDVLDWLSFRIDPGIPESLHKDVLLLVDAVIDPIDELARMVDTARKYFRSYAESERVAVKEIIRGIRSMEHNADEIEEAIKSKAFQLKDDPITIFHTIRLAELIGTIADHAENAGDMMRAMVAR